MYEDPPDLELRANRFNRLVKELLQGEVRRTTFERWEVEFLLDFEGCGLTRSRREEALRRYQKAVHRQLERGEFPPVGFAEFVGRRARKLSPVSAASGVVQDPPALNP